MSPRLIDLSYRIYICVFTVKNVSSCIGLHHSSWAVMTRFRYSLNRPTTEMANFRQHKLYIPPCIVDTLNSYWCHRICYCICKVQIWKCLNCSKSKNGSTSDDQCGGRGAMLCSLLWCWGQVCVSFNPTVAHGMTWGLFAWRHLENI